MIRAVGGWWQREGPTSLAWLVVVSVLCGCGSSVGPTEPGAATTTSEVEYQLVQMANHERERAGAAAALTPDPAVSQVARRFSEEMKSLGFFSHTSPDGRTLRQRLDEEGIQYRRAGENIVQVSHASDPASHAHELLMDSPGHRANILDPEFRIVGVGVARSGETYWITQVFITR